MTIESARALYQKINEDADLRISLEALSTKEEKQQLVKDAGYDITCEEWNQVLAEIEAASSSQELSEQELESVAGGISGFVVGAAYGSPGMFGEPSTNENW